MAVITPAAGEQKMLRMEDAQEIVMSAISQLEAETVALRECFGRILAQDICAGTALPPFDNSAMDGYAVRSSDTHSAAAHNPSALRIIDSEPAGSIVASEVGPGAAVRIMTGAIMPEGADAVVPVEDIIERDGEVIIQNEVTLGANVRPCGEDVRQNELVLRKGTHIGAAQMGMLAALGWPEVVVYRKPRAAIIATGSELVGAEETPQRGRIRDSNSYSLLGQVLRAGAEISLCERVTDELEQLAQVIDGAAEVSDIIITSGGVSVGDYDLVKETLAQLGDIHFWRVAIKPGKPLAFGSVRGRPLFGLPGNPVSSMVTFDLFVRPALLKMAGAECIDFTMVCGTIRQDIKHKEGRREYVRAVTTWNGSGYVAAPTGDQGSGRLSSMLYANSYIIIPEGVGSVSAGSAVEILLTNQAVC